MYSGWSHVFLSLRLATWEQSRNLAQKRQQFDSFLIFVLFFRLAAAVAVAVACHIVAAPHAGMCALVGGAEIVSC